MVFEVTLKRPPTAQLWRSEGPETSNKAKKLQDLYDKGMAKQYESEKKEMIEGGAKFRYTDGRTYEIFDSAETIEVPIIFQVKFGTITWYFNGPKDETHQEFRDELYNSAAISHLTQVDDSCEKYWRGTNSFHIKKMHTKESENGMNHNHYRLVNEMDMTPKHVAQHLIGLVVAQREMGLVGEDGKEKFLTLGEAGEISRQFNKHWVKINHQGPAKTAVVGKEEITLPERKETILSQYKRSFNDELTKEDKLEWEQNKNKEEPCRSMQNVASMPLTEKLKVAADGIRGLGSEIAHTRQLEGGKLKSVTTIVAMDDRPPAKVDNLEQEKVS